MSRVAAYATRLAALPRALAILELHPAGLPLADLAAELDVRPDDLREVFLAYYLADLVELGNFGQPVVEFFVKSDALNDPLIDREVAIQLGFAQRWELEYLESASLEVNRILREFWGELNIDLVDAKFEFGRHEGRLLLADELTADGARLWERGTGRKLDKDVFRRDLADLGDTYRELYQRVFGAPL